MTHNKRCFLVRNGVHLGDQWSSTIWKKIEKYEKIKTGDSLVFNMITGTIFQNALKFWICFNGNWTIAFIAYKVFKNLYDLNPNFIKETNYRSLNQTHRKDNLYAHSQSIINLEKKAPGHLGDTYGSHYLNTLRKH